MNKELERITKNLLVMEQSLEASDSVVKLVEQTLQKHKVNFKVLMNKKIQELNDSKAAAKKT